MQRDLTSGSVPCLLLRFSLPYLISCFLQTFYGLADLFVIGQFNAAAVISAVSAGSQIMHMVAVVIAGLAMGCTVAIGRSIGAKNFKEAARVIGVTVVMSSVLAAFLTAVLLSQTDTIIRAISTPPEAVTETHRYLFVCFIGVPFIMAYNAIASIFRGLGDTVTPMAFVAASGIANIVLDYVLIGSLHMGAMGAAVATVASQAFCVFLSVFVLSKTHTGILLQKKDFRFRRSVSHTILKVGAPIAIQEGLIQVSFLVITAIANTRGVTIAASVGIVEKIISFFFLVPSAMLSSVSSVSSQNAGAGKHERSAKALFCSLCICIVFGLSISVATQFASESIVRAFAAGDAAVISFGAQYLKAYIFDCIFAGIHFSFSGYFCAYNKALYSFFHNIVSIVFVRIPGAYFASVFYPDSLYPMGMAAPAGSLLSAAICFALFIHLRSSMKAHSAPLSQ